MLSQAASPAVTVAPVPDARPDKRYLFGPVVDFLCLGGASFILLPVMLMLPVDQYKAPLAAIMLMIGHAVNHPHFAHSYQIFYDGFVAKAFHGSLGRNMQLRYLFAGLVAPALLVGFLIFGIVTRDAQLLGYGANLMGLAVGWHYVKQGYGMLMVDAALKKRYLDDRTKKVLLVNCYVVWIAAWMYFNRSIHEQQLFGLQYFTFAIPEALVTAGAIAAFVTGGLTVWALAAQWREKGALPANGVIAYVVSLYLWLLFVQINPLWLLVTPALHSLQYLVVVWRYRINYERERLAQPEYKNGSIDRRLFGSNVYGHLGLFVVTGVVFGFLGFWGLPFLAALTIPYDQQVFSATLFLFAFWVAINVHHYFLDNVMWRRENPDTRRYVFG